MAVEYEHSLKGSDENIVNVNVPQPETRKGNQWFHKCSPQYLFLIVMLVAAVLLSLITLVVFLTRSYPTTATNPTTVGYAASKNHLVSTVNDKVLKETQTPGSYPVDPNVNLTLPIKLKIVTGREWLAQPPQVDPKPMKLPVPYVIILETATESCNDQATCTFHVRFLQSFHIDSRGWDDIAFNFLVGGDGFAYEGRGWKGQAAHTLGWNSKSIGIAFIGNFNNALPAERQTIAAKQLIQLGVEKGYIDKNYKLLANRQIETTNKNPGLELYEDLQKWPHWYNISKT